MLGEKKKKKKNRNPSLLPISLFGRNFSFKRVRTRKWKRNAN